MTPNPSFPFPFAFPFPSVPRPLHPFPVTARKRVLIIHLLIHTRGSEEQTTELMTWLRGWSEALAEINYMRTGYRVDRLLDVHVINDEAIARGNSYAIKISAVTDPAKRLPLKGEPACGVTGTH